MMKKIALVYDPIYPYVIGGGEKRFWEIAKRLANKGHDVYLIGMKYWQGESTIVKEGVHLVGICPAVSLYNKKGSRSFWEPFYFGFFVFLHLLKNSYDIIDCGNFPYISCIAARSATFFKRTKFVVTWLEVWGKKHWTSYAGKIGVLGYLIEIVVSKLSKYNIVISEFTKKQARNVLGIKPANMCLVPGGVEYDKLKNLPDVAKILQIIYVGRLIEHKRVDVLIDAFSTFVKSFNDYKLKIVGRGPERESLEFRVESLGLKEKVIFTDFLERTELEKEIKKSKIFVLPSEREGMGIVIVESMALGTPVVAMDSEYSAAKSIIESEINGILVRNKDEIAQALARLITDEKLYNKLKENGYKTATRYDWDSGIIPKVEDYYADIMVKK